MPPHPHPPQTQSDWRLLVVTCSILQQAFSCFRDHQEDASSHGSGPKSSPFCGLPHFSTWQACSGQDTQTALIAHLHKHTPHCNSHPQAICTCTWAFLAVLHLRSPTHTLCTPVLEQTLEAGSSCFEQPAQSWCTSLQARFQSEMTDSGPPSCYRTARARQT